MKLILLSFTLVCLLSNQWEFNSNASDGTLKITGTSTLHDWESTVEDFSVTGTISGHEIMNLSVTVPTLAIRSGKSVMDDKTYEALKADPFFISKV